MKAAETIEQELDAIQYALKTAKQHGLEAEVIWSAMTAYGLHHEKAPETYSVEWALECALNEWDI
jgi:hypothetical protein